MGFPVCVTAEVAGRTSRSELIVGPGDDLAASGAGVIVTTAATFRAWPAPPRDAMWVVLGGDDHELPLRPFLRLAADATGVALEAAIDAALEVSRLRARVAGLQDSVAEVRERQLDLARVGIALTAEHDLDRLLALILTTARDLVNADAGSLYLIEEVGGERRLRFVLAQNDSVPARLAATTMTLDSTSLAGYVALSGEPLAVEDVHRLPPDVPYRFNPNVDLATGYYTRSLLSAPMSTRAGELIGVLQLINRKRDRGVRILDREAAHAQVRSFGSAEIALIRALAAQAAVAIDNTRLVQEVERLFEGFVRASVTAIEQRDPSTSGHSLRVAHYTVSLARMLEQHPPPAFAGTRFSADDLTQLRYAALLHDFGKVGVREAVLTKAKKLHGERLALIQERFCHARRSREAMLLRATLQQLAARGEAPTTAMLAEIEEEVRRQVRGLDAHLATVLIANEPSVLESSTAHLLSHVARERFPVDAGLEMPLLLPEEVRALSVAKGSLDADERQEIESHVEHSYQFLLTLPWPRRFIRVPEIAYGHHEKLDGRGYPNGRVAPDIPLEVRMMTIADIFDALAAGDRPYKRAVSCERALEIIEDDARRGALDPELVRLFIDARVFATPLAEVAPA